MRMVAPFYSVAEVNDVRSSDSAELEHYLVAAVRAAKYDGTRRGVTQLVLGPDTIAQDYAWTFRVPGDSASMLWSEGVFPFDSTLLWSYFHTHAQWVDSMFFFINVTA